MACLLATMFLSLNIVPAVAHSPVSPEVVEKVVRTKFASAPVMIKIARCESTFRQYESDGSLLYNKEGSSAVGVMQIMSSVHMSDAKRLGHDITTLDGNLDFALHLYKTQGTRPWDDSRHCWG